MKNLDIFDYKDTILPFESLSINQNKSNSVKPIILDNGDLFLYDNHHLYKYENGSLTSWYRTNFETDLVFSDELLNTFYIIADLHIRSISYEGETQCYDTDLFTLYEYNGEDGDEIVNAALSPDKEHIVLLTKSNSMITLLSNFKVIANDNFLSSEAKGEKESVNVGWGKVETQFQGSAKSSAQSVPSSAHVDDGPPTIVWCSDSQLFAVSYFSPFLGGRQIKVYKVYGGQCSLQYTSKLIPGLESHLSWRPHIMSHLASTQRLPNKYVLVFIEKNTEVKDLFELRNVTAVRCVKWSQDGNILAVMTVDNRVLMYTNSNWHWYLKHELDFTNSTPDIPVQLVWTSPTDCSILHNSRLRSYSWKRLVNAASGVVSVIDGNEVLVTDFNKSIIPPPMCLQRVTSPENSGSVNRVLPLPNRPDDLLIITSSNALYTFKAGVWDKIIPQGEKLVPQTEGENSHEREKWDGIFDKAQVWSETELVFVRRKNELCAMAMRSGSPAETLYTARVPIVSIHVKSHNALILQLENRDVIVYARQATKYPEAEPKCHEADPKSAEATTTTPEGTAQVAFTLPELCTHIDTASGHLVALSPAHTLYDNGAAVLTDVSSFVLHSDWLLVTTLTHRLVLFRLVPGKQVQEGEGISRALERGGTLVAVSGACQAVLQLPRGNLESVTPRPLLLSRLSALLSEKQYGDAYVQMRKHRIDLNLLIDYAPPDYSLLVSQVDKTSWLSNLVADLKAEDVTRHDAYYAEYYAKCALPRAPIEDTAPKHIATICAHLRAALQCRDAVKYAHTIMHCAVKAGDWDEAFGIARASSGALDFLILLHDVNGLYEMALRAYDLDLALQIAGKSQKDPKEYVPYLNRLRSLPPHRMKAEIDKQFGSYLSAVRHLSSGIRKAAATSDGNSDVTTKPSDNSDVTTKPSDNSDVTTKPSDNSDVNTKPSDNGDVTTKPSDNSDVNTKPSDNSDVNTKPSDNSDVNTKPSDNGDVTTKPSDNSDVTTKPSDNSDVNTKPSDNGDVTTKPSDNSDVTTKSSDNSDVTESSENSHDVTVDKSGDTKSIEDHDVRGSSGNSDVTECSGGNSDVTDTEECLELIRKHKLWSQTLDVFPKFSESYNTVLREYGLQLELRGRPEEAGLMYARAAAHGEGLRCFVKAGAWRSALVSARALHYGPSQLDTLYADLSRSLRAKRDVPGLVSLLEQRRDVTDTRDTRVSGDVIVSVACENPWLAVELARQYGTASLIESDIKPALSELHTELVEEISAQERTFASTLDRLLLVRSLPKPVAGGAGGPGDEEMSDWGSETGSTLSTRSAHTGASSSSRGRRKRKQDRKLWSLREGNPREEISLVKSLAESITALENYTGRVRQLCLALVCLEMDPLAQSLQSTLRACLATLDQKRAVIWPSPAEHETSVDDARVHLPPVSSALHHWELECLKSV